MSKTKYHGEIEIKDEEILHFEKGIPGFLDEKEFVILPLADDQSFSVMQSVNKPNLGFVVVSPFLYFQDYEFELEDSVVEELGIKSADEVLVYSLLTVKDPFEKTTANLQGPV